MSPMINGNYSSAYEDFAPLGGTDTVNEPAAEAYKPAPPPVPTDEYAPVQATPPDDTMCVLPYELPGGETQAASTVTAEQAQQAVDALNTLYASQTPDNAAALAPAIEFWTGIAQEGGVDTSSLITATPEQQNVEAFDENGSFKENVSDDVLAAWDQVFETAAQNYDNMINGFVDVSPEQVVEMQQALADAAYATAFGAMFEGNVAAAQQAAELALTYVDSLKDAGVDVSQFDNLVKDLTGLIELGEMDLTYMLDGTHASVQEGHITAIGKDDQAVVFDAEDLAMMTDTVLPDDMKSPNPDSSMDPGFDGTGLDLGAPADAPTETAPSDAGGDLGDYGDYSDGGGDYGSYDGGGDYGNYDGGGDYGDAGGGGGGSHYQYDNAEE